MLEPGSLIGLHVHSLRATHFESYDGRAGFQVVDMIIQVLLAGCIQAGAVVLIRQYMAAPILPAFTSKSMFPATIIGEHLCKIMRRTEQGSQYGTVADRVQCIKWIAEHMNDVMLCVFSKT